MTPAPACLKLATVIRTLLLALVFPLLWPTTAPADSWRVASVIDGDTLELADGRRVRLAGIEAAKPPRFAVPGERSWPLADAATAALVHLVQGRAVTPRGAVTTDRHGHLLAHLLRDDGLWLQTELLAQGHARVHTRPDARAFAAELLATEDGARRDRRGLWRTRVYAVRAADPETLARDRDSFQIVEGRVLRVTKTGGEAYLDFGEDWRSDVTVHIARGVMREFAKAGIDPLSYEGKTIRVRGWIGLRSGPMIEATHPEQIERVSVRAGSPEPPAAAPRVVRPSGATSSTSSTATTSTTPLPTAPPTDEEDDPE
ncbi:thermonuclease family protein [Azospirillum griseum]|uniref:Thermonuclease family protein n=1 Tax=Azospirillum griseum TaxID=2496639 RepID=A0A3S0KY28_9PROT|nr:thermonuclease family protein [Azospirillum griseum]RTR19842.1 thermonuclease family protein [Azospirillum griseum]